MVSGGSTVVFPTDTIYGLGTTPMSGAGIERCFRIKNRQTEKKLPILFSSAEEAERLVAFDARARLIAERFWPGQVTLVLPMQDISLPRELYDEERTLAVRVPNHDCCLRLIASCGNSLIGTSANLSGTPSFVDPNDPSLIEFAAKADYFVKGNCGNSILPSTILDLTQKDTVLIVREGAVPSKNISDYLAKASNTDFSFKAIRS
jgi:L-threonylcarbamoyladenylate synthase